MNIADRLEEIAKTKDISEKDKKSRELVQSLSHDEKVELLEILRMLKEYKSK